MIKSKNEETLDEKKKRIRGNKLLLDAKNLSEKNEIENFLLNLSSDFRGSNEYILKLVENNPVIFLYLNSVEINNKELQKIALLKIPFILSKHKIINLNIFSDKELKEMTLLSYNIYEYLPERLKKDTDLINHVVSENIDMKYSIPEEVRKNICINSYINGFKKIKDRFNYTFNDKEYCNIPIEIWNTDEFTSETITILEEMETKASNMILKKIPKDEMFLFMNKWKRQKKLEEGIIDKSFINKKNKL